MKVFQLFCSLAAVLAVPRKHRSRQNEIEIKESKIESNVLIEKGINLKADDIFDLKMGAELDFANSEPKAHNMISNIKDLLDHIKLNPLNVELSENDCVSLQKSLGIQPGFDWGDAPKSVQKLFQSQECNIKLCNGWRRIYNVDPFKGKQSALCSTSDN
jgi:hypothetical protein